MDPLGPRGLRPAKTAAWSVPLSPESSSDNASDNSDLFGSTSFHGGQPGSSGSSPGSCPQGRKRKMWDLLLNPVTGSSSDLLEQYVQAQVKQSQPSGVQGSDPLQSFKEVLQSRNESRVSNKDKQKEDINKEKNNKGTPRMTTWQVEDIDDNLAADFDGSLSGLGVDLTTASYNMSEALMALPPLTVFKEEAHSPSHGQSDGGHQRPSPVSSSVSTLHPLLASSVVCSTHATSIYTTAGVTSVALTQSQETAAEESSPPKFREYDRLSSDDVVVNDDLRFQYVLAAATSVAVKVHEETLTYLNQGQPYELKLKKLGELSAFAGRVVYSLVRLCFHDRRLQVAERQQVAAWQRSRPGDRLLEVDLPLSYGVFDVVQDPGVPNAVTFTWDPLKEAGVYIKLNAISTEFTPRKHGGEKGVPFRLQVETYEGNAERRLHVAVCQVKVFKLKGADRKHKQDRERIMKRPSSEIQKFQPSCHCTVLGEVPTDSLYAECLNTSIAVSGPTSSVANPVNGTYTSSVDTSNVSGSSYEAVQNCVDQDNSDTQHFILMPESSASETAIWLQNNRFNAQVHTFANFAGADLLRLTRDDLIQICGLADGIRLHNAMHSKATEPRLTLYVSLEMEEAFHALYLHNLAVSELVEKLSPVVGVPPNAVHRVFIQGPNGVHVVVTDDVIRNLPQDALLVLTSLPQSRGDALHLLLKQAPH